MAGRRVLAFADFAADAPSARLGFSAQAVVRGEEALAVFKAEGTRDASCGDASRAPVFEGLPKVLLLDVNLGGGMQASEVLDELGRRGTAVRVILSSGLSQEDVPASLREHRLVVSYLAKPYTVDNLVAAINAALG